MLGPIMLETSVGVVVQTSRHFPDHAGQDGMLMHLHVEMTPARLGEPLVFPLLMTEKRQLSKNIPVEQRRTHEPVREANPIS